MFQEVILSGRLVAITEAATGLDLLKKVFLKISQNSQQNTCARVSLLIKLQASETGFLTFLTKFLKINSTRVLFLESYGIYV